MPLISGPPPSGPPPIKLVFHPFQKIFIESEIAFTLNVFSFSKYNIWRIPIKFFILFLIIVQI